VTTYTEELANSALPLVGRIVDDLVARYAAWQSAVSAFEYATTKSTADVPDPDAERLQREAEQIAEEIEHHVHELDALGVECRAFDTGLVAFPAAGLGRPVWFWWKRGDRAVSHSPDGAADSASAKGTSISMPSRAHPVTGNTSFASRSRSDGSRE
jgi:hypothetical protein